MTKRGAKFERTSFEGFANILIQKLRVDIDLDSRARKATVREVELNWGIDQQTRTGPAQVGPRILEVVFSEIFIPAGFDQSVVVGIRFCF